MSIGTFASFSRHLKTIAFRAPSWATPRNKERSPSGRCFFSFVLKRRGIRMDKCSSGQTATNKTRCEHVIFNMQKKSEYDRKKSYLLKNCTFWTVFLMLFIARDVFPKLFTTYKKSSPIRPTAIDSFHPKVWRRRTPCREFSEQRKTSVDLSLCAGGKNLYTHNL